MKKLLLKLITGIFLIIFTSCGEITQEDIIAGKKIVGTPIQIENLEVAEFDFPEKMSWIDANYGACRKLGDGRRIPNKDELNILYQNKDDIGGFDGESYWSSSVRFKNSVYFQNFIDGNQDYNDKSEEHTVRAVRSIN
jgi:hypothetical protein